MRSLAAAAKEKAKGKGKAPYVPDTPVRALGRLLWRSELEGEMFVSLVLPRFRVALLTRVFTPLQWKQIESLESREFFSDPLISLFRAESRQL
jgi:hypothetical protein